MASAEPGQRIRFSAFEVDLKSGELRKNGAKIKLQQQPLQVLVKLLQHPGEIVTREELRNELWPSDTFVDFDHSLNAAIARLRDALGESAEKPIFIETLARRGYRFNAPLIAEPKETSNPQSAPVAAQPAFASFSSTRAFAGLAIIVLLIAAGAVAWTKFKGAPPSSAGHIASIAVLPLENLSRDPEQDFFSEGMTSAIITNVSNIQPLRVISRTSTERYKGTTKSLPQIARELNADAVIEGSVVRAGNRVRVDVELIDGATDKHIWSASYDRELVNVLQLHSDIAQAIATRMQLQMDAERAAKLKTAPAVNQAAYENYLRGRRFWNSAGRHPQLRMAQDYFQKSLDADPHFAPAWVGLADTYLVLGMTRRAAPQESSRKATDALNNAQRSDPNLSEAFAALGDRDWQYEWNWPKAEADYRQALTANPSNMEAHESYAWFLGWSGRRAEAVAEIALMRQLDPAFPLRCNDEAGLHYHQREYEELVKSGQQGIDLDPDDWSSHYFLGIGKYALGQYGEAIAALQKAASLSDNDQDARAALAFAYLRSGRRADAMKIADEMKRESTTGFVSPYMLGVLAAGLGDRDRAFAYLEQAHSIKSTDLAYFIKADPRLDSLRADARFADLAARVAPPGMAH